MDVSNLQKQMDFIVILSTDINPTIDMKPSNHHLILEAGRLGGPGGGGKPQES